MGVIKNIAGQRFGMLRVVGYAGTSKDHYAMWICKCDCGSQTIVRGVSLRRGNTTSCGCQRTAHSVAKTRIHGMSQTKIYSVWRAIKKRCKNPADKEYDIYGGRGIRICDEWDSNFLAFYEHVSKLPHFGEEGYTIDRINNDGDYEPENVKMSTYHEQALNRHKKRWQKKPIREV